MKTSWRLHGDFVWSPWSLGGVCFVIANPLFLDKCFAVSDGAHEVFTRSLSGVFEDFVETIIIFKGL
jgi:hypothetical protein